MFTKSRSSTHTGNRLLTSSRLVEAEIIPTVIDDFVPFFSFSASWKPGKAKLGNTIKPSKTKSAPTLHLHKPDSEQHGLRVDPSMTYVFALTDPDAPSRDHPKWSEFCHWIASGTPILSSSGALSFHLKDLIKYKPPGPPPKTGKHRYVFIAFVPANGTIDDLNLTKPKHRKHWGVGKGEHGGVREWAEAHGLIPVGKFCH